MNYRHILGLLLIGIVLISGCIKVDEDELDLSTPTKEPTVAKSSAPFESQEEIEEKSEIPEKPITHLKATCYGSENWDADAEDDGISIAIQPLDVDNNVVKTDGVVEIKLYVRVYEYDQFGFSGRVKKGVLVYTGKADIKKENFVDTFFEGLSSEKIRVNWDDVKPYSKFETSDYGLLYVTLTTPDGKSFEAKYGDEFEGCRLRNTEEI